MSGAHACAATSPQTGTNSGMTTKVPYMSEYARLQPRSANPVFLSGSNGSPRNAGTSNVHASPRLPIARSKVRSDGFGAEWASQARMTYSSMPLASKANGPQADRD